MKEIEKEKFSRSAANGKSDGYKLIILATAFTILFLACSICYSYGVILLPIIEEFHWPRGLTSIVVLLTGLIYSITIPFTGLIADRYGFRKVLLSIGCLLGLGLILTSTLTELWQLYIFTGVPLGLCMSATYGLPVSLVALWFNKRQGLAIGIATLGISLGTATSPLILTHLITIAGWRNALMIAGVSAGVIFIAASAFMIKPPDIVLHAQNYRTEKVTATLTGLSYHDAIRTSSFRALFCLFLLFFASLGLILVHLIPYAVDFGLTPIQAAFLITLVGIFGIPGRLVSGYLSDQYGAKPVITVCLSILASIICALAFISFPEAFYIIACLYGLSYSGTVTMLIRITRDTFGDRQLSSVFATLMISDGVGFGVVPFFAGYIFDITGSYNIPFLLVGIGLAVAALLAITNRPVFK